MNPHNPDCQVRQVLEAFEVSLAIPVMAGELDDWMDRVRQAWTEVSAQIRYHTVQLHHRQYQEIAQADPEMFSRVEQLQVEDENIEHERDHVERFVVRMLDLTPKCGADEERAQQQVKTLTDNGISFVHRVRKQEVALQSWFVEAFSRDRGVGD